MRLRYQARILYREPIFESMQGPRDEPFEWGCTVEAEGPAEAEALARVRFAELALRSSVCWVREIERIELTPEIPIREGRSSWNADLS